MNFSQLNLFSHKNSLKELNDFEFPTYFYLDEFPEKVGNVDLISFFSDKLNSDVLIPEKFIYSSIALAIKNIAEQLNSLDENELNLITDKEWSIIENISLNSIYKLPSLSEIFFTNEGYFYDNIYSIYQNLKTQNRPNNILEHIQNFLFSQSSRALNESELYEKHEHDTLSETFFTKNIEYGKKFIYKLAHEILNLKNFDDYSKLSSLVSVKNSPIQSDFSKTSVFNDILIELTNKAYNKNLVNDHFECFKKTKHNLLRITYFTPLQKNHLLNAGQRNDFLTNIVKSYNKIHQKSSNYIIKNIKITSSFSHLSVHFFCNNEDELVVKKIADELLFGVLDGVIKSYYPIQEKLTMFEKSIRENTLLSQTNALSNKNNNKLKNKI